jgi:hypothetical protein
MTITDPPRVDTADPAPLPAEVQAAIDAVAAPAVPDFDALVAEVRTTAPKGASFVLKGREFHITSPLDWSDEMLARQAEAAAHPDTADVVGLAVDFLGGPDEYEAFRERGGTAMRLQMVLPKLMGASMGESSAS